MADYAGALAAIKSRLQANWTTTPIAYLNERAPQTSVGGEEAPWVMLEIVGDGSELIGAGKPGDQVWRYDGAIELHVFVPTISGTSVAFQHAVALGEIFRAKEFYNTTPGFCVRSWSPSINGGESASEDGKWFGVTCTVPFEYWHRG